MADINNDITPENNEHPAVGKQRSNVPLINGTVSIIILLILEYSLTGISLASCSRYPNMVRALALQYTYVCIVFQVVMIALNRVSIAACSFTLFSGVMCMMCLLPYYLSPSHPFSVDDSPKWGFAIYAGAFLLLTNVWAIYMEARKSGKKWLSFALVIVFVALGYLAGTTNDTSLYLLLR